MKPSVRHELCPHCRIPTWIVRGPNQTIWMCSRTWWHAIGYALQRGCATQQPGTGDQVHNIKESNTPK